MQQISITYTDERFSTRIHIERLAKLKSREAKRLIPKGAPPGRAILEEMWRKVSDVEKSYGELDK